MNSSPRISSILFHEADIVLRFFAFAIIRVLHTTGTNDDPIWMNCEPVYRTVYLKCLQEFPGDFIQSFHLYIAELEYYESRSTRSKSKKDGRSVHKKASSCHLIQSIAFGSQIHAENTILASSSPKNLTFILPAKGEVPGHFQYIEIPVHHILQLTQYTEGTLGLSLDTIGPIMMDGKERLLHESTAYMTADSDLQDLCTAIRGNGQKIRKGQIIRRTSATVVTLDTGEEVARKSIQHREKLSHALDHQSDLSEVELHDFNDQKQPEPAVYEQNEPHVGPKLAQKASSLNESLLLTSQIAAIPTNTPSKASGLQSPEGEPILEQRNENIQVPGDDLSSPVSYKGTPKDTIYNEHQEPNVLTSQLESTMRSADDGTGPRTTGLVTQNPQRRISRKRNGRMSSQKGPERCSTRRKVSTNRNDRLNLPDTQESLLFPRSRRSNKKVYTSNSKAAVDWEEDLRPTEDDEEPETNIPRDIEVTSVSSPVPGDTSIFHKSFTTKPKRKARVTPSSIKGKKRTQRRKAVTNKRKKTDRLLLQTKTSNSSNTIHETAIGHEAKDAKNTENENTYVPTEAKNTSSLVLAGDASAITPTPYQFPLKCSPVNALEGDCEIATVKDGEQESTPRSNRNGSQMMTNSTPQKQYLGSKVQDSSDKATARSKRISESTAPADEQGSSMSCASAQGSQAPDMRSNKRQYPESANSLRPQHDELGLNSESAKDRTTGIKAQSMMTRSGFQQSELEQGSPVYKSGKRTVTQDCMGEGQNQKASTAVASMLDKKNIDHSANATTVKLGQEERSENDSFSRETSAAMKGCPEIPAGKRPTSPSMSPQSRSSASGRASELSTIHISGQGRPIYSNFLSSTSPKKSIVDDNGSPRLVSRRFHDNIPLAWRGSRRLRFERDLHPLGEASSQSGYHGDSDDVDFITPSLSDTSSISKRSWSRSASASNSDANEIEETSYPNKRRCIPVTDKLRRAKGSSEQPIKAMITPFSLTASPQKAKPALDTEYNRGMKAPHPELKPSPSIASVFLEQELAQLSKRIEGSQSQASWQASLEAIQKALHDMLLNTSEVSPNHCIAGS